MLNYGLWLNMSIWMISICVYDEMLNADWGSDYVAMNIYIYRNMSLIRNVKWYIDHENLNDIYM